MTKLVPLLVAIVAGCGAAALLAAQDGSVRITAARANIRVEARDTAPVVAQLPAGTDLVLKAIEGDWFRVQLPADSRLGGVRVEAYVSRKVARLVTPIGPASASGAAGAAPAPGAPSTGMSVALKTSEAAEAAWLTPETARVRMALARVESIRGLSSLLTAEDPPAPTPATSVTFAWVLPAASSRLVVSDWRPTFVVQYTAVPGAIAAADLVPDLVRLVPTIAGVRIIGAITGASDLPSGTEAAWEVMRDWRHESLRPTVQVGEPGTALVQPRSPLEPGEYAVVLRPNRPVKVAPSAVFTGPAFLTVWTFSVR